MEKGKEGRKKGGGREGGRENESKVFQRAYVTGIC